MRISLNDYVVIDGSICHGKPTFRGTRVMVWQVLEMLEEGMPIKTILKDFPSLNQEHVKAALRYAASLARGKSNVVIPA